MEGSEVKPVRTPPPKPAPYLLQRPPVAPSPYPVPSSEAPPTKPGRKPPPSVPPPPPPRVDLGETPVDVASVTKDQSKNDLAKNGSLKLMPKGRPEISILSAKPMDSTGVIPAPSVPSQPTPVAVYEEPKVPQRRKTKGREPPPRPKTRPVSELALETGELNMGPAIANEKISPHKEDNSKVNGSSLNHTPVCTTHKLQNDMPEINEDLRSERRPNDSENLNETLNARDMCEAGKKDQQISKVANKPTIIKVKPGENEPMDSTLDRLIGFPVVDTAGAGKKSKPTVIIAKPPKKALTSEESQEQDRSERDKEEKPIPDSVKDIKPLAPLAKKLKPAVKPKPSSVMEAPVKEHAEEKKMDSSVTSTPKAKPTVILPVKPAKSTGTSKPGGKPAEEKNENEVQKKASQPTGILPAKPHKATEARGKSVMEKEETAAQVKTSSRPTVILPAKPSEMPEAPKATTENKSSKSKYNGQACLDTASVEPEEMQEGSAAPQSVKNKRVPTIIIAPRPQGKDTSEVRKPPKRPQRGPSIKRTAPPRPGMALATENKRESDLTTATQEEPKPVPSALVTDKVQRKPRPLRPVSMSGVKENERSRDEKKLHEGELPVDTEKDISRRGSRKKPPPPRPPATGSFTEEVDPTSDLHDQFYSSDEKSSEKHRPAPHRPPLVEPDNDKANANPAAQERNDRSKGKSKPPRPPSRNSDSSSPQQLHKETMEDHVEFKTKPARPAPVLPRTDAARKIAAETRTVAESSANDHVKDTCNVRGSPRETDHSAAEGHEKTPSKSKPKPPRPASSSVSSKHKPRAQTQPVAKSRKKTKEDVAPTPVSSVCETYIEPSAIALYDYEPTAMDDLSFSTGDEIVLVKKIDDEWYIGRLGDQEGMFPVKFVEIIEDLPQEIAQDTQPAAVVSSPLDVMALYDFHGNKHDGELVFSVGDVIHVIEKINDDWLKGETRGQTGAFPCNFVDISTDIVSKLPLTERKVSASQNDEETQSKPGHALLCKARFDYNSGVPEDLSFNAGDIIDVLEKASDDWIKGELRGRVGIFPLVYVEMLEGAQEKIGSQTEEVKKHVVKYSTALYDFTASALDELSFKKGDEIEVTEVISDDWLRGKLGVHEGMFPRAFVQLSKESEPQSRKDTRVTSKARALFDFDGEFEDELSFKVDDDIIVLERINEQWLKGEVNRRVGRFPAAFVQVLTPLP